MWGVRWLFSLLSINIAINCAFAQSESTIADSLHSSNSPSILKLYNNVFVEVGGAGYIYSFGYERTIYVSKNKKWSLFSSIEVGNFGKTSGFSKSMMADLSAHATFGIKHKIESQIGWIWAFDFDVPFDLDQQRQNKLHGQGYAATIITINTIGLGYRWEINSRWGVRAMPIFIFKYDFDFGKWYGIGFWGEGGVYYKFGKK